MHPLFSRTVQEAAQRLVGKVLRVNGHTAVITKVLAQTEDDNRRWLASKPLFGPEPVDVYVSKFRSAVLLFLRTEEKNTCVRIEAIEIAGERVVGPTAVCRRLGIDATQVGSLETDGTVITISWQS